MQERLSCWAGTGPTVTIERCANGSASSYRKLNLRKKSQSLKPYVYSEVSTNAGTTLTKSFERSPSKKNATRASANSQADRNRGSPRPRPRAGGGTILLTTHYMEEATRLCDRGAIMDHGKVIALGTPAELIESLGADQI